MYVYIFFFCRKCNYNWWILTWKFQIVLCCFAWQILSCYRFYGKIGSCLTIEHLSTQHIITNFILLWFLLLPKKSNNEKCEFRCWKHLQSKNNFFSIVVKNIFFFFFSIFSLLQLAMALALTWNKCLMILKWI